MTKTKSEPTDDEQTENGFDERWVRICEMDAGSNDAFSDFADEVTDAMADTGNKVGRPLVMKVTVEVHDGKLNRPNSDEDQEEA